MPLSSLLSNWRLLSKLIAALRIVLGITAAAAPRLPAAPWVGVSESNRPSIDVFGRALGGRDLALGAAVFMASDDQQQIRVTALGALADTIDAGATLMRFSKLPRLSRFVVLASTIGASVSGAICVVGYLFDHHEDDEESLPER